MLNTSTVWLGVIALAYCSCYTWACFGCNIQVLIALLHCVNQALVDAPDMVRCQMNFKRLSLTDIKIDIKRVPKKTTLIKAMEEAGNDKAYAANLFSIYVLPAVLDYKICGALNWFPVFLLQMWRPSGRTAHGARSWLSRRGEQHSMTSIGSRSCWRRSRLGSCVSNVLVSVVTVITAF